MVAERLDQVARQNYAIDTVSDSFLVIGHRGAAGLAPEHTRPSFERALALAVDMIELDVQLTRDHQLVVMHDRELGRTATASGPVREWSLAELKRLDTGAWFGEEFRGEGVLTLEEVFEVLGGRVPLNVEIKSPEPDWEATARQLAAVLTRAGQLAATVVSSFEMGALAAVRAEMPAVQVGVLWQSLDLNLARDWMSRLNATSFHPFCGLVSEDVVRSAHQRGRRVYTWTVNDDYEIARVAAAGVDGIISDFPDRVLALRRAVETGRSA
ncbi:MAG TPA: glycerophosphodiester phosphodiesterase family protein [Candidatus Kryptonia bacterium]|nr:glycerophosphodiester phosphodiesterase family protein [Candidatus Kryptonia bacterium]